MREGLRGRSFFNSLRILFRKFPEPIRESLRPLIPFVQALTDPQTIEQKKWQRNHYAPFINEERNRMFLSITRFCIGNRPMEGYYFEFGCYSGSTMRLCWKHTAHNFDWTYVAFDSFEGLPEINEFDRQEIWQKGKLQMDEDHFIESIVKNGMPRERLKTVKGFYDQSLTKELAARLLPKKAVVIYVDCDLHNSTVPVLNFIRPFLQIGTIIVFDDWYAYYGDPQRGERRAWAEFLEKNSELKFVRFVENSGAKAYILVEES